MNKHLHTLMRKEMTRKEFLATMGFGVASLFGFSTVVELLSGKSRFSASSTNSRGYGNSAYGGNKE